MAGNRVEELETKVRELEATIDGLTDELVETKERLHELEKTTDAADPLASPGESEPEAAADESDAADETEASAEEGMTDEDEDTDSTGTDDIIVA
ncbi:MAG: bZIP transcription factor [Natronomonas sp.]